MTLRLGDVLCTKNNKISSTVDATTLVEILRNERNMVACHHVPILQPVLIIAELLRKTRYITEKGTLLARQPAKWLYIQNNGDIRSTTDACGQRALLSEYKPNRIVQVKTSKGKWSHSRVVAHLYTASDTEVFYFMDNKNRRILWDLTSLFQKPSKNAARQKQQQSQKPPIQLTDVLMCMHRDKVCSTASAPVADEAVQNSDDEFAGLLEELRQIPDEYFNS